MLRVLAALCPGLVSLFRSRSRLDNAVHIAALEQQLGMLLRDKPKPRFSFFDRAFWVALCRNWTRWRQALVLIKPQTVRPFRSELDRWLHHALGVRGMPIPYGAPNANAVCERVNRTLRERVLNHFIFLNVRHLLRVLRCYVEYHNRARPSQAIRRIPDPYPELRGPPPTTGKLVGLPVLSGLHHDYRRAA